MQQSWREEEDGTIVVLAHSVEHEQAPVSQPGWSWYNPVRTQVIPQTVVLCSSKQHALALNCPPSRIYH